MKEQDLHQGKTENNIKTVDPKGKGSAWLKTVIKLILVLIVLYFVYRQLAKNWDEVVAYSWEINPLLLLLSVLVHIAAFSLFSRTWCLIISAYGHKVKLPHAFKISYIVDLGRYIPGKIWPVFGMAYLARQIGIREEESVTSWILAMLFALPAAFAAGGFCIIFSPELLEVILGIFGGGFYAIVAVVFAISLLLVFVPNEMFKILNLVLRIFRRPEIKFKLQIKTALLIFISYAVGWSVFGLAFWLFLSAITSGPNLPVIPSIGTFIIAYQIGYLTIFAPGGIGVRELVLSAVLTPYLGSISAGVAVAARIWNISAEIVAALIAWFIRLPHKNLTEN